MTTLDLAIKPPCRKYRELLKELLTYSKKTQRQIAEEVEMDPPNLSRLLAGARAPLLNPEKNLALARACGRPYLGQRLQLLAEACHTWRKLRAGFRRYMALKIRALEALLERAEAEIVAIQELWADGEKVKDRLLVPESLLAARKVVNSLRFAWPVEESEQWDDYWDAIEQLRESIRAVSATQRDADWVAAEVEEALEWVRAYGDLDGEVEKDELIRRLAELGGFDEHDLWRLLTDVQQMVAPSVGVGSLPQGREIKAVDRQGKPTQQGQAR